MKIPEADKELAKIYKRAAMEEGYGMSEMLFLIPYRMFEDEDNLLLMKTKTTELLGVTAFKANVSSIRLMVDYVRRTEK